MLTDEQKNQLVQTAITATRWAYAPYSNYKVGVALLTSSGRTYDGINIENAAYPTTMCAERVAVFKAVSEGEREFEALAVVSDNAGSPCGACRQGLAEFGLDTIVLIADIDGAIHEETILRDLLPSAFRPENLLAPE